MLNVNSHRHPYGAAMLSAELPRVPDASAPSRDETMQAGMQAIANMLTGTPEGHRAPKRLTGRP